MKKLLLFILMLALTPSIFAEGNKSKLTIAYERSHYHYREPELQYPPHWRGDMEGFSAKYIGTGLLNELINTDVANNNFIALELRYMFGKVNYDGYLQDGTPAAYNGINDYYIEGALTAGVDWEYGQGFIISPYLGLGLRYLVDKLDESGDSGYRRQSTYFYMPAGISLKKEITSGWSIGAAGEFDVLIIGNQTSKLGWDLHNKQNEGYGIRISARAEGSISAVGVFIEPFARYWYIENSEVQQVQSGGYIYSFIEPKNVTSEYGFKVGLTF